MIEHTIFNLNTNDVKIIQGTCPYVYKFLCTYIRVCRLYVCICIYLYFHICVSVHIQIDTIDNFLDLAYGPNNCGFIPVSEIFHVMKTVYSRYHLKLICFFRESSIRKSNKCFRIYNIPIRYNLYQLLSVVISITNSSIPHLITLCLLII